MEGMNFIAETPTEVGENISPHHYDSTDRCQQAVTLKLRISRVVRS